MKRRLALDLRETGFLKVLADYSFSENKIVLNPNDGFDLGLMTSEVTLLLYAGGDIDTLQDDGSEAYHARLYQKNECRLGTIEISLKTAEKLGNPKLLRLHLLKTEPYPKLLLSPA